LGLVQHGKAAGQAALGFGPGIDDAVAQTPRLHAQLLQIHPHQDRAFESGIVQGGAGERDLVQHRAVEFGVLQIGVVQPRAPERAIAKLTNCGPFSVPGALHLPFGSIMAMVAWRKSAPSMSANSKFAPWIAAPRRSACHRFAPERLARTMLAQLSEARLRLASARLASAR